MSDITRKIADVRRRMDIAAEKAGRAPNSVTLLCVSKKVSAQVAMEAVRAGYAELGESRVQEARLKRESMDGNIKWHMIGSLQVNKAKYCPGLFSLVHSIDRIELACELSRRALRAETVVDGLLQVNILGETNKAGCKPEKAVELLKMISAERGMRIRGLMTIAPFCSDPEETRPVYRELMGLKADIEKEGIDNVSMQMISAGMSNDFEVAIEEGATIVRIGTAIFGERDYS